MLDNMGRQNIIFRFALHGDLIGPSHEVQNSNLARQSELLLLIDFVSLADIARVQPKRIMRRGPYLQPL